MIRRSTRALLTCALLAAAPAALAAPPLAGARYVAMGSSFASGAGIAPFEAGAPARCQRSTENYAHQLARVRKLTLVDVTCGGATTAHILGPWGELPPQIDALTPDTALVTLTIGGNDVGYIGGLVVSSCPRPAAPGAPLQPVCKMIAAAGSGSVKLPTASEEGWRKVEASLTAIVREIRRRAPRARIVLVDYLTVLPRDATCAQAPVPPDAAKAARAIAARLAQVTADVARRNGAELLPAAALSVSAHNACAAVPWMAGFIAPAGNGAFAPYHPNLAGMTAIARALDRMLAR